MNDELDPSEDREEFERRLKSTFDWKIFCGDDPMTCLLMGDTQKLDEMKSFVSSCTDKISYYLTEWDNASTKEEKQSIVGSVRGTLE